MKLTTFSALAIAGALVAAAPAQAQVYDAFTSFNGTQNSPSNPTQRFIYGTANTATPGIPGSFFATNTNCAIAGSFCLQASANGGISSLPGVYAGGSPIFQYGTVNVPQDRLLIHPGDNSDLTFAAFVAPTAGQYRIVASFNPQDISPTGVSIFRIGTTSGGLPLTFNQVGSLSGVGSFFSDTQLVTLGASEAIGYGIGNGGSYFNDSTGVQFTVTAVPEPATWAMMMLGVGAIGFGLRRRKNTLATPVAFA